MGRRGGGPWSGISRRLRNAGFNCRSGGRGEWGIFVRGENPTVVTFQYDLIFGSHLKTADEMAKVINGWPDYRGEIYRVPEDNYLAIYVYPKSD